MVCHKPLSEAGASVFGSRGLGLGDDCGQKSSNKGRAKALLGIKLTIVYINPVDNNLYKSS